MIDRRTFIVTAAGLLAAPLVVEAQTVGKVYRIGSIASELPATAAGQGVFWDRMRELGWSYGKNVVIEYRMFGGDSERIPSLAQELMALGTDVFIVGNGTVATRVQRVTRATPIVTTAAGDLVAGGFAANMARPGGNVTGVQFMQTEIGGKHLSLLKENDSQSPKSCQKPQRASGWPSGSIAGMPDMQSPGRRDARRPS